MRIPINSQVLGVLAVGKPVSMLSPDVVNIIWLGTGTRRSTRRLVPCALGGGVILVVPVVQLSEIRYALFGILGNGYDGLYDGDDTVFDWSFIDPPGGKLLWYQIILISKGSGPVAFAHGQWIGQKFNVSLYPLTRAPPTILESTFRQCFRSY